MTTEGRVCSRCGHAEPHTGGGIGVCLHAGCGCDGGPTATDVPAHWKGNVEGYYASRCARQADALRGLEARLAASAQPDLAERCLRAEAHAARLLDITQRRESAYVKGYQAGYMAALSRHGLDRP